MRIRSLGQLGLGIAVFLPACESAYDSEEVSSYGAALTSTDVTPTLVSQVTDRRHTEVGDAGIDSVFDNDRSTKLRVGKSEEWIQYRLARPTTVTSYEITSANDSPEEDPQNWTLEGSVDGVGYTVIDRRDHFRFTARGQTRTFVAVNDTPYLYYRLNISDNRSTTSDTLQLAEFRIGGTPSAGVVPSTPTIENATASGTTATLSWSAVPNATGYYVQRISDDGRSTHEVFTADTTFTQEDLAPASAYVYQVQAANGSLRGVPSGRSSRVSTASPPAPDKDVTALSPFEPSDAYGTTGNEGVLSVTDNNAYTKYLARSNSTSITLQAESGAIVTQYTLTSANDAPERDPQDFTLEGSNDGVNFTLLDTRTSQGFGSRFQTRTFTCNPSREPYGFYRLSITKNHGSDLTQLAEFRLLGTADATLSAPLAPSEVTAVALSGNQVSVKWADNAGQRNPESGYVVEQATNSAFTENVVTSEAGANSTEFRATALEPETTYYFRVRALNAAGSANSSEVAQATTKSNTPPDSWRENGWYGGRQRNLHLTYQDPNLAVYFDEYVPEHPSTAWLAPIMGEVWAYTRNTYGSFSDPVLYVVGNQDDEPSDVRDIYGGGGVLDVFSDEAYYRNLIHSTSSNWGTVPDMSSGDLGWEVGSLIHELGHVVEFNNNGIWGSPAFGIWGDSKWCEIFAYDALKHLPSLGTETVVNLHYQTYRQSKDDNGYLWFRNWYYPLYNGDFGNVGEAHKGRNFLVQYFKLLKENLPKYNGAYGPRGLNWGEFIHFSAGAAGVDLEDEAKVAFDFTPEVELQLAQAQREFPAVHALYKGNPTESTPCGGLCASPISFENAGYNPGNLGTEGTCHETKANLAGVVCGNFAANRSFRVNGQVIPCTGSAVTALPKKREGGYCLQASVGNSEWAYFSTF